MAGASRRLRPAAACAALTLAGAILGATAARAESAWVKDEMRLNVRTGPGTKYRIQGAIETGDAVDILQRAEGWTQVRIRNGDGEPEEGWIPEGYLQAEMPARLRLARFEEQGSALREQLQELSRRSEALEAENEELTGRDDAQREEIQQLTRENLELQAGARWPDRIAGAAILGAGMILGAMLARRGRRAGPRVRL
jgi:SH3 domain protein